MHGGFAEPLSPLGVQEYVSPTRIAGSIQRPPAAPSSACFRTFQLLVLFRKLRGLPRTLEPSWVSQARPL